MKKIFLRIERVNGNGDLGYWHYGFIIKKGSETLACDGGMLEASNRMLSNKLWYAALSAALVTCLEEDYSNEKIIVFCKHEMVVSQINKGGYMNPDSIYYEMAQSCLRSIDSLNGRKVEIEMVKIGSGGIPKSDYEAMTIPMFSSEQGPILKAV